MNRSIVSWLSVALYFICFVSSNIWIDKNISNARLDLTQDKIYSISNSTKTVLSAIKEPIKIRFYASKNLEEMGPDYLSLKKRIDDLLSEYERISNGLIVLEKLNPKRFSKEEDFAVSDGVQGVPNVITGGQIFLGLSGRNSTDGRLSISHFAPERSTFLEYELTRLIYDLSNTKKRVVAIYGDLPIHGDRTQRLSPWLVVPTIERFFETRTLFGPIKKFNDEIDVLLLAEAGELDAVTLYAIDQFLMRGGRILAFVDPFTESLSVGTGNGPQAPRQTSVESMRSLLFSWGIEIPKRSIVGDLTGAMKVQMKRKETIIATDYPAWFEINKQNFAKNDVVTSNLSLLSFRTAGHIKKLQNTDIKLEPLVLSSDKAGLIDVAQVEYAPDPTQILSKFIISGKRYNLIVRLTGSLQTAFPNGAPKNLVEKKIRDSHKSKTEKPAAIIIVADSDFLSDETWVEKKEIGGKPLQVPFSNNGDLVVNALDQLTGSNAMIDLRGRGISKRRFQVIDNMEREAERNYRSKERILISRIEESEKFIKKIQKTELKKGISFTKKEQTVIENARNEMLQLRMELRHVQFSLRENIDKLKFLLSALNIWAVPGLIGFLVLCFMGVRTYRNKRFVMDRT